MERKKPNRSPESMARRIAYSDAWQREHYDRIVLQVPNGKKERYKQLAEQRGKSLTGLVQKLLDRELEIKEEHAGKKEMYKAVAAARGQSLSGMIIENLEEQVERER